MNGGTRLCYYILDTRDIIIEQKDRFSYTLKTDNNRQEILKMVSEISPAGIISLGLSSPTILLE